MACFHPKLCRMATPRRKCGCASGEPDVGKDSWPTFSNWAAAGVVKAIETTMQASKRRMRTSEGILQNGELDRAFSCRDSPQVIHLAQVVIEMREEMDQELAGGDRLTVNHFRIRLVELRRGQLFQYTGDHRLDRFQPTDQFCLRHIAGTELERPLTRVRDLPDVTADVLTQVAF